MTWYIDALGSAASLGVDVFCRETLTGDWLETIGSWQQADGLVLYTPHPSFWVAALWRKLMGREVLEATVRAALPAAPPPAPAPEFIPWVRVPNVSCVFGDMGPPPGTGSALAALLLPPKCPTGDTTLHTTFTSLAGLRFHSERALLQRQSVSGGARPRVTPTASPTAQSTTGHRTVPCTIDLSRTRSARCLSLQI